MGETEWKLVALYDQASPAVRRRGRSWYPETARRLRAIAETTDSTPAHAMAVFSIVSPAAQLVTALQWTEEILRGEREGGRYPNVQGPKVAAALAARRPCYRVTGEKVNPFYRALQGDTTALVLDRWAIYAAGYDRKKGLPPAVRREVESAYRAAASFCGETVRAFQAIVWIVVRESTPKSNGILPRLTDVTT